MKITRQEWEELNAKVARLEVELREAKQGILMQVKTGPVLLNVVVPMILEHLKAEVRHGYSWLQPTSNTSCPDVSFPEKS